MTVDGRTGLVVGGVSAVAASVAVICAVALTTSAALADSSGSDMAAARVLVPAAAMNDGSGTGTDGVSASTSRPETVQAPDPYVVDAQRPSDPTPPAPANPAPAPPAPPAPAPAAPQTPSAPQAPATREEAEAASVAAGSWDAVRAWASARGWSPERVEEWIARLEERYTKADGGNGRGPEKRSASGEDGAGRLVGTLQRLPAIAGSNGDDRWHAPGGDVNQDQSRESPVWRD